MRVLRQVKWLASIPLCWSLLATAAPEKPKTPIVFVEKLRSSELYDVLTYPARLIPKINATVLSDSDGIVKEITTPLGRAVSRNQKLMVLTHTDPVYDYAPIIVESPVKGVVSSVEVTEGSRVTRGQKLATITDPSQITIVVELAVSDLSAIHAEMPGELKLPGENERVPVKVHGISPFVDPATGTATCELALTKITQARSLPAGFVGEVTFRAREHRGIEVPEQAVVYRGKDPFVRVVENGHARFVSVGLGETRQGQIEIRSGLKEGTQVVLRSNAYVSDGEQVSLQSIGAE